MSMWFFLFDLELILTELGILGNFLHWRVRSLCNKLLQFSVDYFETMHTCGYIEDVHVNFCGQKNDFWQNYSILDLDDFQVRLQYWVSCLCDQLLPGFACNQFETLHRCYKHIEDMHMIFGKQENNFWINYIILDLDTFLVRLQYRVASLCNQHPSINSSQSFQAIYLKLFTDVISI